MLGAVACDQLPEVVRVTPDTATMTPSATASPPPTVTAMTTSSGTFPPTPGVPLEINPIVNAVLNGDLDSLERLTLMTLVACGPQQGPGSPPPCPPGVTEGTRVEVFPIATCEGEYRDRTSLRATYQRLTDAQNKSLVGVYRAPRPYLPHVNANYVAVFSRDEGDQRGLGAGVVVKDRRVAGLWFGCNAPPSQIVPRDADALWIRGNS